jgi:hypothetical protein
MMDWSRVIGVLALAVQILNAALVFVQVYAPEHAVLVAAVIAAIQAFTGRIQGTTDVRKK